MDSPRQSPVMDVKEEVRMEQETRAQETTPQETKAQETRAQETMPQETRAQETTPQEARAQDARALPRHVAVILDGNGRWAKKHGVPRAMGHKAGCETLEVMVEEAARMGLEFFTVYGFSTENWKRSEEEVGALMNLFRHYLGRIVKVANENNVRVRMIGEKSRFAPDIIEGIDRMVEDTKQNTGMNFVVAVNYGGRDEIVRAARKLVSDYRANGLNVSCITESVFSGYLDTADIPDPDLMIRTSGEMRLSNYLLWQLAYAELYVTDCLWPDFNKEELEKAIAAYNSRERRFGGRK